MNRVEKSLLDVTLRQECVDAGIPGEFFDKTVGLNDEPEWAKAPPPRTAAFGHSGDVIDELVDVDPGLPDVPCVYFVQEEGTPFVKIGCSTTGGMDGRLVTLQISNPRRLCVRRLVLGAGEIEDRLHLRFASYRVRGEWFLADGDLYAVSRAWD